MQILHISEKKSSTKNFITYSFSHILKTFRSTELQLIPIKNKSNDRP